MRNGSKPVFAIFFALFITTCILSHPNRALADEMARIAASAVEVQPVRTGDMAPAFAVRTVDDEEFLFDPEELDSPVILITFRGGWCPYCNMHLSELRHVVPDLASKGIKVYFLSGDRPEMLYASLKQETREDINGMGYTILSDANMEAAMALGIAFRADDSTIQRRLDDGRDIEGSSMLKFHALPVPAVYMIDKSGTVVYSFVEPDYKVRLPAEDLLAAAAALAD